MKFAVLMFAMLFLLANAQNTDWYTNDPSAEVFEISNAEELRGLAALVNGAISETFENKTVKLKNNIDLESANFTPIGSNSSTNAFKGIFDGQGNTISELSVNVTTQTQYVGLFGYVGTSGQIKNVNVEASKIKGVRSSGDVYVGGLVANYNSTNTIENCHVTVDSVIASTTAGTGDVYSGGLAGYAKGSISNSTVTGNVYASKSGAFIYGTIYIGGLIGENIGSGNSIFNSTVTGNIFAKSRSSSTTGSVPSPDYLDIYIGGLVGYGDKITTIENSHATGNVTDTVYYAASGTYNSRTRSHTGGLLGYQNTSTAIRNSFSNGIVSGYAYASSGSGSTSAYTYIGGLVGRQIGALEIQNSYAAREVSGGAYSGNSSTSDSYIGGLVGYANSTTTIENSYAIENISGGSYTGGLIGYAYSNTSFENSYSLGNVTGTTYVGGLLGYATKEFNINNSYAAGNVTGTTNAGGLVGYTNSYQATVSNSYAGGKIKLTGSGSYFGGIFGRYLYNATLGSSFTSVYYNSEETNKGAYVCNTSNVCDASAISGISGKTKANLTKQATFVGWDFDDVWAIFENESYPYLSAFAAPKKLGYEVAAPTVNSKTVTSLTINAVAPPANGQEVEYAINTVNAAPADATSVWQQTLTFASLNPSIDYYIFARSKENSSYKAGPASEALILESPQRIATPTLKSWNYYSITINAVAVPESGQEVEYAINTTNSVPTSAWQQDLTFVNLKSNTDYYIFARAKANESLGSGPVSAALSAKTDAATIPFAETFEDETGWIFVNGTQANKWIRGTATKYAGSYSVYISNNNSANSYNISNSSVVHFYRDIEFPESESDFVLTFYFKGYGQAVNDVMTVRYSTTSNTPVAGSEFTSGTLLGMHHLNDTWLQKNLPLPAADFSDKTIRLVFTWKNDGSSGTQPPAAIDDIIITGPGFSSSSSDNPSSSSDNPSSSSEASSSSVLQSSSSILISSSSAITLSSSSSAITLSSSSSETMPSSSSTTVSSSSNEPTISKNPVNPKIGGIGVQTIGSQILLSNLPSNAKVEIYNLQGKRIYSGNSENSKILKIPVQTKGIYIASINGVHAKVVAK